MSTSLFLFPSFLGFVSRLRSKRIIYRPFDFAQGRGIIPVDFAQDRGIIPFDFAQGRGTIPFDFAQDRGIILFDFAQDRGIIPFAPLGNGTTGLLLRFAIS